MLEFASGLFDTSGFVPREKCGTWTDELRWMHVGGDLFIWLAYVSIPLVLLYFTRRRELPFSRLFVLFALFILACGFGHLIEALMFQYPLYRLSGAVKVLTAVVSWATVLALIPVVPRVMEAVAAANRPPGGGTGDTTLHRLARPIRRERVNDYTIAVLAAALALLVRAAIDPLIQEDHFFVLSLLAVVFVSWQAGFGPAVATLLISMAGMVYFFIEPRYSFVVTDPSNQLATAVFFFCGVGCAGLGEAQRRARRQTKAALAVALERKDELEGEVARRREAEGTLRAFYDSAPICMGVVEPLPGGDVRHVYDNPATCRFFGVGPDQTAGRRATELGTPPKILAKWVAKYWQSEAQQRPVHFEYEYDAPDGPRWLSATVSPLPGGASGRRLFCYVAEDVTDRKRADEAVRESEERFRTLAAAMPQIAWVTRPDGYHEYYNPKWYEYTGMTEAESLGFGWSTPLHPDDKARSEARWKESTDTGEEYEIEYRFRGADGDYRWFLGRALPQRDATGQVVRWFGTCTDIHEFRTIRDNLRESEERFRTLADSAPVMIWLADPDGSRTYFNRTWLEFTGRTLDDEARDGWVADVHPDDRDRYLGEYRAAFAARRPFEIEYRLRRRDGAFRWVLARGVPRAVPGGGDAGFIGLCLDVHNARLAVEAVRESEERFRTLTEAIPQIVWNADPAGEVTYFNRRWLDYTGEPLDGAAGVGWVAAVHPDDRDGVFAAWRDTVTNVAPGPEDRFARELRLRHQGGDDEYRWFLTAAVPLRRPDGTIDQWIGSMADIHDQKAAAEKIAENEEKFRAMAEGIPQLAWMARPDGHIFWYNRRWYDYTGTTPEQMEGWGWQAVHDPNVLPAVLERWKASLGTGTPFDMVFPLKGADGRFRPFLTRVNPTRDAAGAVVYWFGTNTDVTAQRELEQALRDAAERFRTLTEAVPQMVWTADPKGEVTFFNRRWDEYTGRPLDQGRTLGWDEIVHPEDAEQLRAEWQLAVASQPDRFTQEFRLRRAADGVYRWMLSVAVPLRDPAGGVAEWVGSITDIDDQKQYAETLEATVRERTAALVEEVEERRRAEAEVRTQREFLDAILANVADGIVACDAAGNLTLFNRAALDFHGLPPEPGPPDAWAGRYDLYRADGATPLPTAEVPLFRALRGERVRDAEMVIAPRGRPPRALLASGQPLVDGQDRMLGAVVSMRDVTERKEAERQLAEAAAELQRANTELARSNDELEKFAYVASHDLQEPLRKIQAFGDRLKTKYRAELPDGGKEYVDRMLTSAGRMRRLIDDLLTFSRVTTQARPFVRVDLGKLVAEVVSDLDERIDEAGGTVTVGNLPDIDADPSQLRQLFQNLIANAVKFRRPGVPPVVGVSAEPATVPPPAPGDEPVAACRVTVRDNGIGFDEKYLDRIFQVFQRLHGRDEYEGTGVGLAICRKIAERHGGSITARSRVGEGAAFVVTLPARHTQPEAPPGPPG